MTLNIKYFDSTMTGAPVITGQVGTLINVLDACLVNGLNPKTIQSLTRSGSTVTATYATAHGYSLTPIGQWLLITGANESAYNGEWRITSIPNSTTLTFDIGSATPGSPATGTLTSKAAPLGMTKPFSGTNVAGYRLAPGSTQMYLGVDDNQSSGSQYGARVRGFETMTAAGVAVANGTGPFPTDAQVSSGLAWYKSTTENATAKPWRLIGDERGFALWVGYNGASSGHLHTFGDFQSYKAGDLYNCLLTGHTSINSPNTTPIYATTTTVSGAHSAYAARSYNQLGSARQIGFVGDGSVSTSFGGGGGMQTPNAPDGGIYLSAVRITEAVSGSNLRGVNPYLYQSLQSQAAADGDVLVDVAGLAGRKLLWMSGDSAGNLRWPIDISGPWRA